jgi:hypothetical protein
MPEAGREDYNELIRFHQLAPGEPYFLIRAQDAVSGDTVRDWAARAGNAGAPAAIVEQALRQAEAIDAWPHKKVPDDGHLPRGEAASLAYALSRRAWGAHISKAPDLGELLAERRGFDAAGGLNRHLKSAVDLLLSALQTAFKALSERRAAKPDETAQIGRALQAGAEAIGRAKAVELVE